MSKSSSKLSKTVLEMKFMKKSKDRIQKEEEQEKDSIIYKDEITPKMLQFRNNFIIERSFCQVEGLKDGRVSYGMNEKIEKMDIDGHLKDKENLIDVVRKNLLPGEMVRAWFMDNDTTSDQRLEHQTNPPEFISLEKLFEKTGVEYFKVNVATYEESDSVLNNLKRQRGYTYEDEITCSKECLPDYENKLKNFYTEHLHTDEEIRFILDGSGYFDVRDPEDRWIRIEVVAGDLVIVPSGIYHRFTLDVNNFIRAKRYFVGEPVWTPHNRPSEEMECRKKYVEQMQKGFKALVA